MQVSKSYGSVEALIDVDFRLYAGEVVGLVGDNGAGKSTLIKVLSGVHSPDSGKLFLEGAERHWKSPHEALAAEIETLYQDSGLAPDLTIGANVFLGREILQPGILGKLRIMAQKQMEVQALHELAQVGVEVKGTRRTITALSGGQRQAIEVLNVIRAARDRGLGVLLISHTLPHVLQVTDRIVVLRLGIGHAADL